MAAEFVVELPNGHDGAPAIDNVQRVSVAVGARLWSQVEVGAAKDGVGKVLAKGGVLAGDCIENLLVMLVQFGLPETEGLWLK